MCDESVKTAPLGHSSDEFNCNGYSMVGLLAFFKILPDEGGKIQVDML
jgi:hypothetical protein